MTHRPVSNPSLQSELSNLLFQILRNRRKLFESGFEVFSDFKGEDARIRQVRALFKGFVFEPEDVEVHLVALGQLFVSERLKALALFAVVAVLRVVTRDKVVEVAALQGVFLEREMLVRAQVVDPELLRPRFFLRGFAVEKQDVGLHALRVEDAGGQAQQRVHVGLLEQFAPDGFARATFKKHVVRQHHRRATMLLEDGEDVLGEPELLDESPRARPFLRFREACMIIEEIFQRSVLLTAKIPVRRNLYFPRFSLQRAPI
jgi:hypothetical protein